MLTQPVLKTKDQSTWLVLLLTVLFVFMGFEVLLDRNTYITPVSEVDASNMVNYWMATSGMNPLVMSPERTAQKDKVVHYIASDKRYHVHRALLAAVYVCCFLTAFGIMRRKRQANKIALITLCIKICHGIFFLWTAYLGRKVTAAFFNLPSPPLIVLNETAISYLATMSLCVLLAGYFIYHEAMSRRQQLAVCPAESL